jgi:hypothetical protein
MNEIKTSTCDDCKARAIGVEHNCNGTTVMFLCKHCSPKGFETQARRDIDTWLNGGTLGGAE